MSLRPITVCDHTFLPGLFRKKPVIFDFGVNLGGFSKTMIDRFDATVFGAEPSSQLFASLPSDPRLHFENVAIGGVDGSATLEIYAKRCASLHSGANDASLGSEVVPVLSLRTFLERTKIDSIDMLKVDIEGAECDMFEAALDRDILLCAQITVEFHDFMISSLGPRVEAIKSRLEKTGFYRINFSLNNGDVLFVRHDMISRLDVLALAGPYKYAMGAARRVRRLFSGS